jgi:hypothetical protein
MLSKTRLLLVVVVWLFASVPSAHADCYSYDNSHPYDTLNPDYGGVCIGTGAGCVQCYTPANQYQNQASVCVWGMDSPWDDICVYFGGPENQTP